MKPEAQEWLQKAESDFDDALFNYNHSRRAPAAFFFHQAAEKALKALQIEETGEYSYSHDLLEIAGNDIREQFLSVLRDLNPVYTGVRYPDTDFQDIKHLDEIREQVEELIAWIRARLNK